MEVKGTGDYFYTNRRLFAHALRYMLVSQADKQIVGSRACATILDMKILSAFLMMSLCFPSLLTAQSSTTAQLSKNPLTSEQVDVYRAFLKGYLTGSDAQINLANVTSPFQPDEGDLNGCMKGFPKNSRSIEVHKFANGFSSDNRIRLVDPSKYKTADVGDFMHKSGDLDGAVTSAINVGLLSLSEVIVDHKHHLAALNFSFQCGMLCGSGGTVVFERRQSHWSRSKRSCGYWQS